MLQENYEFMAQKKEPKIKAIKTIKLEGENEELEKTRISINQRNFLKENQLYQRFFTINQDFLIYVSSLKLKGDEYKIFIYLLGRMHQNNAVILDNVRIAEDLNMRHEHVSRFIKNLAEKGIIIKKDRGNKRQGLGYFVMFNLENNNFLNPNLGFKAQNNQENVLSYLQAMDDYSPYEQIKVKETIEYRIKKTKEVFLTKQIPLKEQKEAKKRTENKKLTLSTEKGEKEAQDFKSSLKNGLKQRLKTQKGIWGNDVYVDENLNFIPIGEEV